MKRKIAGCFLLGILILLLTGCSLVRQDLDEAAAGHLAGCFVTAEPVDLFDMDAWLEDNIKKLNGDMFIDDTKDYQRRLYADVNWDGETAVDFGLEGRLFLVLRREDDYGANYVTLADEGFDQIHTTYLDDDEGIMRGLEGTLWVEPRENGDDHVVWYVNPVYQTEDGAVYLESGQGMGFSGTSYGEAFSQTLTAATTATEDGRTLQETDTLTLHLSVADRSREVTFLQMGTDGRVLHTETFLPHEVPETCSVLPDCAALAVLELSEDGAGEPHVSGTVYSRERDSFITLRLPGEGGICRIASVEIEW